MSFSPEMERSIAVLLFQWQYGMPASSSPRPRRMLSWSGRSVESPRLAAKPSASGATAPFTRLAPRPAGASAPENLLSEQPVVFGRVGVEHALHRVALALDFSASSREFEFAGPRPWPVCGSPPPSSPDAWEERAERPRPRSSPRDCSRSTSSPPASRRPSPRGARSRGPPKAMEGPQDRRRRAVLRHSLGNPGSARHPPSRGRTRASAELPAQRTVAGQHHPQRRQFRAEQRRGSNQVLEALLGCKPTGREDHEGVFPDAELRADLSRSP